MHASTVPSLGVDRSSALRRDDSRSPMWISISTPLVSRSPTKRSPPTPRRDKVGESTYKSSSKRNQSSLLTSQPKRTTNLLLELCQDRQWVQACERCQSHPHEAVPVSLVPTYYQVDDDKEFPPIKRERKNSDAARALGCKSPTEQSVHHVTPLGIACVAEYETSDQMLVVVETILNACPEQVQSNEEVLGATPLRNAVRNHLCTPQILQMLIIADMKIPGSTLDKAVFRRDQDGLYPIDHLIMGVHAGKPSHSLESLRVLTEICPQVVKTPDSEYASCLFVSPLIRLLSMGTSFGLNIRGSDSGRNTCHTRMKGTQEPCRMTRLLECAKFLLPDKVAETYSRSTKCTALHVAIRNYGNMLPLIQFLLKSDKNHEMVQKRNLFGDLPLHVASSVGVPSDVLTLLLQHTIAAQPKKDDIPHPLVWSANKSGYTPVDLEWMRHIEGGRGFFEMRSFYPLEARGIRNQCPKQNKFYRGLLQEAVDQVMEQPSNKPVIKQNRRTKASTVVGALLDRIVLIVHEAHNSNHRVDQTDQLLHAASALTRVPGPTLPTPLIRLFEWINPDHVGLRDDMGRLPLHHALMAPSDVPTTNGYDAHTRESAVERASWVQLLLERSPTSAYVCDNKMRLPLHYALDGRHFLSEEKADSNKHERLALKEWRLAIIEPLVDAYPDSVDRKDPISGLYPFMQAAQDSEDSSVEVIFFLLRRNPALVKSGTDFI